jgi:hypothetical protein
MANAEDISDKAFAELFELFSKLSKSPHKAYRTYQLSFENGEPVFTLSEIDRIFDEVLEKMFGPSAVEITSQRRFESDRPAALCHREAICFALGSGKAASQNAHLTVDRSRPLCKQVGS